MRHSILYLCIALGLTFPAQAINIQMSYAFDTNNFFDPGTTNGTEARSALSAAAARFSEIITSSLDAVPAGSTSAGLNDWRISFSHPGTGNSFEVSTASDSFADDIVDAGGAPANLYDPSLGLAANTWILYAGGRSLSVAAEGGTGTGTNFSTVFEDSSSHLRRNWRSGSFDSTDLPVWGGAIGFDSDGSTNWHFHNETIPGAGEVDFYSIALREVGHALGLSGGWDEYKDLINSSDAFTGANALAALDSDNGTTGSTGIDIQGGTNRHFKDNTYDSLPFENGCIPAVGTDGMTLQDLLLEPVTNFSSTHRRFELTNVDVGALQDIGWEIIPEPSSTSLLVVSLSLVILRRRRG